MLVKLEQERLCMKQGVHIQHSFRALVPESIHGMVSGSGNQKLRILRVCGSLLSTSRRPRSCSYILFHVSVLKRSLIPWTDRSDLGLLNAAPVQVPPDTLRLSFNHFTIYTKSTLVAAWLTVQVPSIILVPQLQCLADKSLFRLPGATCMGGWEQF